MANKLSKLNQLQFMLAKYKQLKNKLIIIKVSQYHNKNDSDDFNQNINACNCNNNKIVTKSNCII